MDDRGTPTAEAIKQDGFALEYASGKLRGDRKGLTEAVKQEGLAGEYASVLRQEGVALEYASGKLKGDRGVVPA
eukprot:10556438-Heterocapsa_arctica.AAC.1